ncbi:MAG: transglutaminase-like domain-containing protein [Chloroflexi bacterium]|nr:transglutaminase-like domain-containing protein [Chloroflexota bacterium]
MHLPDIWNQFDSIVRSPDEEIDLARTALLIAATEYPKLNVERELYRLGLLADGIAHRVYDDPSPLYHLNTLSEYLFDEVGFRGNYENYYDPKNSFFNDVLERRLGIPITLSMLYIEVGRRVGVPLQGIGMPGHFLVKHADVDDHFVDPYQNGVLLTTAECKAKFNQVTHGDLIWDERYLSPVSSREFVARMLRNLKAIYLQRRDYTRVLSTIDRLLSIQPEATEERRDRGVVNYRLGNHEEALQDLNTYVSTVSNPSDAGTVHQLIDQIQGILDD